ncbi:unnamed protein product, partial [Ectocarpus fasciculatus]
ASSVSRCAWAQGEVNHEYHDQEWGVFQDDDQYLFEMLILEGAQAGLSWTTILNKRSGYRRAFDNFDISRVASYNAEKMADNSLFFVLPIGIVRNRLKIRSAVANANVVIAIQNEYGSFATYLWSIVNANRIDKYRGTDKRVAILSPDNTRIISTDVSDALSKDLKKRGMSFVGTTIMYAYMQAVGLVNDHELTCFRRGQV